MRFTGLVIIAICMLGLSSCSTPKTTAQFYHTHKVKEGVTNVKIPGWLMWLGGSIAKGAVKDSDAKAALKLAKKTGKMRLLVSEEPGTISNEEVLNFLGHAKKRGYQDLIQVRTGETLVNILARDKKEKLKNLMIMVNEEDTFVFLDLKTRVKYDDLSELINYFINREEEKEKEQQEAPEKEEKPSKPRA